MKSSIFIYTNFDRRRIGFQENNLEYEVGDFTILKAGEEKVMVYATMEISEEALYVLRHNFKSIYQQCRCEKFCEHLNKVVETIIELISNEKACKKIKETLEAQKAYRDQIDEMRMFRLAERFLKTYAIK